MFSEFFLLFALFKYLKMISVADSEMLLGFTADGLYEIILRPGKIFFQKIFFLLIFVLLSIFNRVNV